MKTEDNFNLGTFVSLNYYKDIQLDKNINSLKGPSFNAVSLRDKRIL